MPPRVISVHVGQPVVHPGRLGRTAIEKKSVLGPVRVEQLGMEGDQVADVKYHGGIDQAVYAFTREDLDLWAERLGGELPDGIFGENLTTQGIDLNESLVGERWQIGTVTLQTALIRHPCNVFQRWMDSRGFDSTRWVKRFTQEGRAGVYLRVLQPGKLAAGDELTVVSRPDHGVTVGLMFRALTTERELLPGLLDVGDDLAPAALTAVQKYVART